LCISAQPVQHASFVVVVFWLAGGYHDRVVIV